MVSKNKPGQFFIFLGIMLITFGIGKLDTDNLDFSNNQKPYIMFILAVVSIAAGLVMKHKGKRTEVE